MVSSAPLVPNQFGEGIVAVNALRAGNRYIVPDDPVVPVEGHGELPREVLDKTGRFVGPLGHELLVLPLQKGIERGRGSVLDRADQLLEPDETGAADLQADRMRKLRRVQAAILQATLLTRSKSVV